MKEVEHVIIGAGLAGLVSQRFLDSSNTVLLDPAPFSYKVGESLIPEVFRHPIMRGALSAAQSTPSFTPKHGTTFVADDHVVDFPLGRSAAGVSMHVFRPELERALASHFRSSITRERVIEIDLASRSVRTDRETYHFRGTIIDCSGPAMVVASRLGQIENLRPVHASWAYHDVVSLADDEYEADLRARGVAVSRLDPRHHREFNDDHVFEWTPSHTTILTQVDDGVWCWQIPLFKRRVLSIGVVSRHGPIDEGVYRDVARKVAAGCFKLSPRPRTGTDPLDRFHQRSGFARRARHAATQHYVLLSDAFAFSDPVYSVGTGVAVNQAIYVAERINAGPWDADAAGHFCERAEHLLARANAAFDLWYSGGITNSPDARAEVQGILSGALFRDGVAKHYRNMCNDAELEGSDGRDPFHPIIGAEPLNGPVGDLLGTLRLGRWRLHESMRCAGGVRMDWQHDTGGRATLLVSPKETAERAFKNIGPLSLSYLADAGMPEAADFDALMRDFASSLRNREDGWRDFVTDGS